MRSQLDTLKKVMLKKAILLGLIVQLFVFLGCWSMPFIRADFDNVSSSKEAFSFDQKNVPDIGTVYHYKKSNKDGSNSGDVWIYIESYNHTESFKIYPFAKLQKKTDLVIADYDTMNFGIKALKAYLVSKAGVRSLNASVVSEKGETYTFSFRNESYDIEVGHIPSFNYNFDWCDFTLMYRHLMDKESTFSIGVLVPDSSIKFVYAGKADFKFLGIVEYKDVKCRHHEISGEAFGDKTGVMYTDTETGALIEINMPVRNNRTYNSFLFTLEGKTNMTKEEWNKFIYTKTNDLL